MPDDGPAQIAAVTAHAPLSPVDPTLYPQLLDYTSNLLAVLIDGRVGYMNRAGRAMLGYGSGDDHAGISLDDLIHVEDRQRVDAALLNDSADGLTPAGFTARLRCMLGTSVPVRLTAHLVPGHPGVAVLEAQDLRRPLDPSAEARLAARGPDDAVVSSLVEGVVTIDLDGRIMSFNPAAERLFGYRAEEVIGAHVGLLMPTPVREPDETYSTIYAAGGMARAVGQTREIQGVRRDGTMFALEISVAEIRACEKRLFMGVMRDVSARRTREDRMRHMAHHDFLTSLPNRALFNDRLAMAVTRATRQRTRLAVLFIDLDAFKPINDRYGHDVGDQVLVEVAHRLQGSLRRTDTVARLGGDEFVVLLEGDTTEASALHVAAKVAKAIHQPIRMAGALMELGCSIGVAVFPAHATTSDGLCRCADMAMYRAKRSGGGIRVSQGDDDLAAAEYLAT